LKHTDEYIKEIFSKKLGEYESHVSPELWSNIASQLPQAAATTASTTTAVVAKTISAKLIWTAAIVAVTIASVVTYAVIQNNKEEKVLVEQTNSPTISQTQETTDTTAPAEVTASVKADDKKENATTPATKEKTAAPTDKSNSTTSNELIPHSNPMRIDASSTPAEPVSSNQQNSASSNNSGTTAAVQPQPKEEVKEALTAKFTTAPVNKEDLRYFFMPQFTDGASYLWDFGNGVTSTEMSPMYAFDEEGSHQVTLTLEGKDGEKQVIAQTITVYKPGNIVAPNIFTPNGDGDNDFFDVITKSVNVAIQKIVVMSPSGIVFESDGQQLWDGNNAQGIAMPAGEYQFFISGIDKEKNKLEKKGSVTLRR